MLLLTLVYAVIVLRNAWVCDDAYISFRTLDNFVNGYGLTFNVVERVQAFTHPLWLFLLAIPYAITREAYFTSLVMSVIVALAAVWLYAFKLARSTGIAIAGVAVFILSDAFIDYSTSGLENPLTYFLLALFLYVYFSRPPTIRTVFFLSLVCALAALNRMDIILLLLPALVYEFWNIRGRKAIGALVLGFAPLIIWEMFSLLYYGLPFPNTAYSKLGTGLDTSVLVSQGLLYLYNSVKVDPLTVVIIACGIIAPLIFRDKKAIPIAVGMILLQMYIVRIGGCFMSGRHLAAPLFAAVVLLSRAEYVSSKIAVVLSLIVILALGLLSPYSPVRTLSGDANDHNQADLGNGIVDERAWYHLTNGLLNYSRNKDQWPDHSRAKEGLALRKTGEIYYLAGIGQIGMIGYFAGPKVYISDGYALVDPFLARLPVRKDQVYKPGHFTRNFPPGYLKTIETGRNRIADKNLAAYYNRIRYITSGNVFSYRRMGEIVKFNTGAYAHLLNAYLTPHLIEISLEYLSEPRKDGSLWCALDNTIFDEQGVQIDLGKMYYSPSLEISRDGNDVLRMLYFNTGRQVAEQVIPPKILPFEGMAVSVVDIPAEAVSAGYDMIRIFPIDGDGRYSLGHIIFPDETEK